MATAMNVSFTTSTARRVIAPHLLPTLFLFVTFVLSVCRHNATTLEKFQYGISKHELYAKDDPLVDRLLHDMATQKILHVSKYHPANYFSSEKLKR